MDTHIEKEVALDTLTDHFKQGSGSFFLGAGASYEAGLPSWGGLMKEMCEQLESVPAVEPELKDSCKRMLADKAKWLSLASILKRKLGTAFVDYIDQRFCDEKLEPTSIQKLIASMEWQYIATTNYDDLMEAAYSEHHLGKKRIDGLTYDRPGDIASYYYKKKKFVLYCHGRARTDAENLVISDTDYRQHIQLQIGYRSILQTLFTSTSFLFVGASFTDPDIRLLMGFLHDAFHKNTPPQFALIPENEKERAEVNQIYHDYKMHLIALPEKDYENNVIEFLKELKARIDK